MQRYLQLGDLNAYKIAFHLSNEVWGIVKRWDYLSKNTVGTQFIRAVDSISANIAEGFGRYTKKEKVQFYRYAYGSVQESLDWNAKAKIRKLMNEEQYMHVLAELKKLPKEINHLINFTKAKLTI